MKLVFEEFEELWEQSDTPPDVFEFLHIRDPSSDDQLQLLLIDQHFRWRHGMTVPIVDYVRQLHDTSGDCAANAIEELVVEQFGYWESENAVADTDQFLEALALEDADLKQRLRFVVAELADEDRVSQENGGRRGTDAGIDRPPRQIDRYELERELGSGTSGSVFLATDTELKRQVAIKIPSRWHMDRAGGAEAFLAEARIVASLDAPAIVPVFDVGVSETGSCYVVSKFIAGGTLADRMQQRVDRTSALRIVAAIARALHDAHRAGVVHRDVKPANILIDQNGAPWLTDFGLALRERNLRARNELVGTPAWMSPEQARGEGHRVDARSDVYSLGVILHELLTGRRPFEADNARDLLQQIRFGEPRPLRQFDESIPRQLDRICLKAIARREFDRYGTALDFAEDLEWAARQLSAATEGSGAVELEGQPDSHAVDLSRRGATASSSGWSSQHGVDVVPRGLRSFGAEDADFFLSLVPGTRTREGTPESVDFWTRRLLSADRATSFSVGIVYGPSGCGKSSLFKAGILPRAGDQATVIYLEATAAETERQLLQLLVENNLAADTDGAQNLPTLLQTLRCTPPQPKIVICIDQFEQWLHAWDKSDDVELIRALRQCDGVQVQAVLLVRDDFWMAVTQFMRALGERLVEHKNSGGVDLFDARHAASVLRKFGRAFGALPEDGSLTPENEEFVDHVVQALADNGRIVAVRLALFAEMVRHKPWVPETLDQFGGIVGVGVAFLEETFGPRAAPQHRFYATPAKSILRHLLPDPATNIRGVARSRSELLEVAGFCEKPDEFDEVLRMLDVDLRLITLVDEQHAGDSAESSDSNAEHNTVASGGLEATARRRYQLSHDYLVPSLREWLTLEQRRTLRGRLKLQLAETTADWRRRPEKRRLPSLRQYLLAQMFVPKNQRTADQRDLLRAAGRHYSVCAALLMVCLAVLGLGGLQWLGHSRSNAYAARLLDARTAEVPAILQESQPWNRWLIPRLRELEREGTEREPRQTLHLNLALLSAEPERAEAATEIIRTVPPDAFGPTLQLLSQHRSRVVPALWELTRDVSGDELLRAASALAQLDPSAEQWNAIRKPATDALLNTDPLQMGFWSTQLLPARAHFVTPLLNVAIGDISAEPAAKSSAAFVLSEHAVDSPRALFKLAHYGTTEQMIPALKAMSVHAEEVIPLAEKVWQEPVEGEKVLVRLRKSDRKAAVACVLFSLDHERSMEEILRRQSDPTVRSYSIKRFGRIPGVLPRLTELARQKCTAGTLAGLLLAMGEALQRDSQSADAREAMLALRQLWTSHPDAGVHSAAQWALQCGDSAVTEPLPASIPTSEDLNDADGRWFVNRLGQTFAVIVPEADFLMGGDPEDFETHKKEARRRVTLPRSFAIATHEVTKTQFEAFQDAHPEVTHADYRVDLEPEKNGPIFDLPWFLAVHYCNWLSQSEGISKDQWCYEPNGKGLYAAGMKAADDCLERTGYRLPTPAEWEYACRAGTSTSRYHGEGAKLLVDYAWFNSNTRGVHEVGRLKPNDYGLFDMLGNASEWSHSRLISDTLSDEAHAGEPIAENQSFFLLGGSIHRISSVVRASSRRQKQAGGGSLVSGIRLVRTIAPLQQ